MGSWVRTEDLQDNGIQHRSNGSNRKTIRSEPRSSKVDDEIKNIVTVVLEHDTFLPLSKLNEKTLRQFPEKEHSVMSLSREL